MWQLVFMFPKQTTSEGNRASSVKKDEGTDGLYKEEICLWSMISDGILQIQTMRQNKIQRL